MLPFTARMGGAIPLLFTAFSEATGVASIGNKKGADTARKRSFFQPTTIEGWADFRMVAAQVFRLKTKSLHLST